MWRFTVLTFLASASAQIPSLGWCPDLSPMNNFDMNRFLGTWYEAERFFTVSELGSRCVTTNYLATPEGRIIVSNEITGVLTGFKRLMEGSLQMVGREGEGRFMVKYISTPLPYDYEYSILDTDYDNYAVMWSCSGIGPVHTQNTWLLTRERIAPISAMQNAYNVLDRFKISRTFFIKTNQADCTILPEPAAVPLEAKAVVPDVDSKEDVVVIEAVKDVSSEEKIPDNVVPLVRAAIPEMAEEINKPIQVPELIMSESEKKDEGIMKQEEPMGNKLEIEEIYLRIFLYYRNMSVLRAIAVFLTGCFTLRLSMAQILMSGPCPDVQAMDDFDPGRYLGKWYEAEKYFFIFEFGGRCVTADYKLKENGTIRVLNKQINNFSGIQNEIQGEAVQVGRTNEAKLSVRFPTLPVDIAAPYWVVDTDYVSYALVWSCYNKKGILHTQNAWILTRERNPPRTVLDKALEAADKNGISREYFQRTDQRNCPDFDE
ncbi:hypothetical protein K1T71_002103 [Dendrolimus kikuchii]|uniref:Uncharacterized protein n=1 Tax=Dendrolimus kikuchii TaxID=765133 RepID=A0ACC1DFI0_9NEOP|nr:hypothetical protein K1T71_002103 [Dendrolimus kikuchii]